MTQAAQVEFPDFPISESQSGSDADLIRFLRLSDENGGLVPQSILAEALGVNKQRVSQFVAAGRFRVVKFRCANFVPVADLERFMAEDRIRKGGRPRKAA